MLWRLAISSLWRRRSSALLTMLAVTVSIFVLLGVEQIRQQAKDSFGNTVSGIDLIVGARTGDINLLLYSVFRLGNATNNISWQSYQAIASNPSVEWTIPISLGDSHKGYRVMGTTGDYFTHFRYGQNRPLVLAEGAPFSDLYDVVLGSEVARTLEYKIGDKLVLAHGLGKTSFSQHDDKPFRVAGIFKPTGTPVDQTLHISLQGIEAIHVGWQNGTRLQSSKEVTQQDLTPKSITAFMVGLKSKLAIFTLQRQINTYRGEPLLAILPGVTLTQLWQVLSAMENTLQLISILVFLASLLGLAAMLLASLRERQREFAIMRAVGASPWFILILVEIEALAIVLTGVLTALVLLLLCTHFAGYLLMEQFSVMIEVTSVLGVAMTYLPIVLLCAVIIALIPAISAYRFALHQQLSSG